MAQPLHASTPASSPSSSATFFGIPIGDFGWFGTLLVSVAAGFLSFFASTFCSIVVILIVDSSTHANIDYAISYRDIGLPIGVLVLICALGYLGTIWLRRIFRKA